MCPGQTSAHEQFSKIRPRAYQEGEIIGIVSSRSTEAYLRLQIRGSGRQNEFGKPEEIGADVWIGGGAIIAVGDEA